MKKPLFVTVLAIGVLALAGAGVASAQETLVGHVPFPFVANGKAMPAGDYRVMPDPSLENVLQIMSKDGRYVTFAIFEDVDVASREVPANFEFKKLGGETVLWRVGMPGRHVAELPLTLATPADLRLASSVSDKTRKGDD